MHDDTDCFVFSQPAHHKYASCRRAKVDGAESAVGAAQSRCLIEMTDKHDGTACPLRHLTDRLHHLTNFICPVHIDPLSEVALQRVEDQKPGIALHDGFFDTAVQQMQGFFILADIDDPVLIGVRFGKAGLTVSSSPSFAVW